MIFPIMAYGHSMLRVRSTEILTPKKDIQPLVEDMWETMYNANGCGLAAVQIGKPYSLFIVDSKGTFEILTKEEREIFYDKNDTGIQETFINTKIIQVSSESWKDNEGCLSIPGISALVKRPWSITVSYQDRNCNEHIRSFSGLTARMIQHEFDHTNGILFFDHLSAVSRRLIERKLTNIKKKKINPSYPLKFTQ